MFNFILYDNQLHFWELNLFRHYIFSIPIEIITGIEIDELKRSILQMKSSETSDKIYRCAPHYSDGVQDLIIESGDTVSAAWKKFIGGLEKNHHIFSV